MNHNLVFTRDWVVVHSIKRGENHMKRFLTAVAVSVFAIVGAFLFFGDANVFAQDAESCPTDYMVGRNVEDRGDRGNPLRLYGNHANGLFEYGTFEGSDSFIVSPESTMVIGVTYPNGEIRPIGWNNISGRAEHGQAITLYVTLDEVLSWINNDPRNVESLTVAQVSSVAVVPWVHCGFETNWNWEMAFHLSSPVPESAVQKGWWYANYSPTLGFRLTGISD